VTAITDDFGIQYDNETSRVGNDEGGCGDRVFEPTPYTEEVLSKYYINEEEYEQVCKQLEEGLHFGRCSMCV